MRLALMIHSWVTEEVSARSSHIQHIQFINTRMTLESPPGVGRLIVNAHDGYLPSHLCTLCQRLDFRALLSQSEAQSSTRIKTRLTGDLDEFLEYKPGLPSFFQHQKSLGALEKIAKSCKLCELIFKSWFGSSERSETADKAIDHAGQGQLFVGTSGYCVSRSEIPIIIVTQKPDGHSSRTLCTFDVFSERGECLETFPASTNTSKTP